jgi:hypothetical protein
MYVCYFNGIKKLGSELLDAKYVEHNPDLILYMSSSRTLVY